MLLLPLPLLHRVQAAQATPTQQATVQGQLDGLMQQFVGGNTPAWAAGAIRSATAAMAARGLGASSLAGQAIVQAAMESALPIAQADAQYRHSLRHRTYLIVSNVLCLLHSNVQVSWVRSLTKHSSHVYRTLHVLVT